MCIGIGGGIFALGLLMLFSGEFLYGLIIMGVGALFVWAGASVEQDNQQRHHNDYGKVARCWKCGSTNVYHMTYDDKRDSIQFWGAASTKIGKTYHCDNCGNEW